MEKMREKLISTRQLFLALGFILFALLLFAKAKADPTDYADKYYSGTVSAADGARMFAEPGSGSAPVNKDDGTQLIVPNGTMVYIYAEKPDPEGDIWYECSVTVDGKEYKGCLYTGRVTRGEAIAFTPTPVPEDTPTPVPTEEVQVPTKVISEDTSTSSSQEMNESTKKIIDDSDGFGPWKWIIILIIIIVVFMLVYTIWVKKNEERLEREIERYSGKSTYEPLDGESEEDFEEAKSTYFDTLGLGADVKEVEEQDLAQKREERRARRNSEKKEVSDDSTLTDLIASLEDRIGKDNIKDYDSEEEFDEDAEVPEEEFTEEYAEETEEFDETAEEAEEVPEELEEEFEENDEESIEEEPAEEEPEFDEDEDLEEMLPEIQLPEDFEEELPDIEEAEESAPEPEEPVVPEYIKKNSDKKAQYAEIFDEDDYVYSDTDIRYQLNKLKKGDKLTHKVYGVGIVIDNSDSEIINVRFGKDVRYLKKDKLAAKNLVKF